LLLFQEDGEIEREDEQLESEIEDDEKALIEAEVLETGNLCRNNHVTIM
jgi:hypothetical protein